MRDAVPDRALVLIALENWKAAWTLLSTALAKLEGQPTPIPPGLTFDEPAADRLRVVELTLEKPAADHYAGSAPFPDPDFVPVSGPTPPPTRNITTRERLRGLESQRSAEWRRALFGPQLG